MTIQRNITVRKVIKVEPNSFKVTRVESPRVIKNMGHVQQNINMGGTTYEENLTGTINGINTVFTTTYEYIANSTRIFKNGLKQKLNTDYTESGTKEITFDEAPDATGFSDILTINYIRV